LVVLESQPGLIAGVADSATGTHEKVTDEFADVAVGFARECRKHHEMAGALMQRDVCT
jgi:hypothetical protein